MPREIVLVFLEHGPYRHPLATRMVLIDVVVKNCVTTGCGCYPYSDRGSVECPCHMSPAKVATLMSARDLQMVGHSEKILVQICNWLYAQNASSHSGRVGMAVRMVTHALSPAPSRDRAASFTRYGGSLTKAVEVGAAGQRP